MQAAIGQLGIKTERDRPGQLSREVSIALYVARNGICMVRKQPWCDGNAVVRDGLPDMQIESRQHAFDLQMLVKKLSLHQHYGHTRRGR